MSVYNTLQRITMTDCIIAVDDAMISLHVENFMYISPYVT